MENNLQREIRKKREINNRHALARHLAHPTEKLGLKALKCILEQTTWRTLYPKGHFHTVRKKNICYLKIRPELERTLKGQLERREENEKRHDENISNDHNTCYSL